MSDKSPPEAPRPKEKADIKAVFEHLFPGNNYASLRKFNPINAVYLFDKYLGIGIYTRGANDLALEQAILVDEEFARRIEMGIPDKLTIGFSLSQLTPITDKTSGTNFNGHSFEDLVRTEIGEHLGGVAKKRIPTERTTPGSWVSHKLLPRYYEKPMFIIGILDNENKPAGWIEFKEGADLKKRVSQPKKVEPQPSFQPSPVVS